jgi:class 3 adenylate cyclase/streptogramin lyase
VTEDTSSSQAPPSVSGADIRTFLFADMRGYTRFTQEQGDNAASALAGRFADLVKETVPAFEGELLELRGDEALCVFSSARQALRAAVELQRRLRAPRDTEVVFPLGVGIGLDAGEAVPTKGGYRGSALNLAARLCSHADGGDILATERLIGLAGPVEGLHRERTRTIRLKGVQDPERVVQIQPDETIPPPPALPPQPTSRRRRMRIIASAVIVVAVAAGVVVLITSSGGTATPPVLLRANSIAVIDPSTRRVVADVHLGSAPGPVVAGLGRIWVGEPAAESLSWINPSTLHANPALGVPVVPASLAVTDSSVVAYDGGTGRGAAIDPDTLQPTTFHVPNPACGGLSSAGLCDGGGLAVGGGHVWVATLNSERVFRLDPVQLTPDGPPTSGVFGDVLAWGLNSLWAYGDKGTYVYQIDPIHDKVIRHFAAGNAGAFALTQLVTGNGQVWVLDTNTITVLDPNNPQPVATIPVHNGLTGATAAGQWLWVTTNDGRLYQISLFTKKIHHFYRLHHAAAGVAVANNRVWVALDQ